MKGSDCAHANCCRTCALKEIDLAAKEAKAYRKANNMSAKAVHRAVKENETAFYEVATEWSGFGRPCHHKETGYAEIKFWIIVLSSATLLKTVATGEMTWDLESVPGKKCVRPIELDRDAFCTMQQNPDTTLAMRELRHVVDRERSFGCASHIVSFKIAIDEEQVYAPGIVVFRCPCSRKFPVAAADALYTLSDFEQSLRAYCLDDTPENYAASAKRMLDLQTRVKENDETLTERERRMFEHSMTHTEIFVRMCRACNRYGMILEKCGGCKRVWYCNRECQLNDWNKGGHSKQCSRRCHNKKTKKEKQHHHE